VNGRFVVFLLLVIVWKGVKRLNVTDVKNAAITLIWFLHIDLQHQGLMVGFKTSFSHLLLINTIYKYLCHISVWKAYSRIS